LLPPDNTRGVGAAAGLIPVRRAGELLEVHPQDLRQAQQDSVTVNAALVSLNLGQPGLGPADQPGAATTKSTVEARATAR
jgi:hypothetical protein